jgi:glycolate oxidase FAD binding subunit
MPSRLADVVTTVPDYLPGPLHANALNGIVWFHAPESFGPSEHHKLTWMEQRLAAAGSHHYVMRRCPAEYKKTLRVWGRPIDRELMSAVKETLDPDNVFNPGRFLV